jgi:ATP-binding cassette subfamily F protein 3
MIRLDRVRRQFGPRILFEELSWTIPPGARLGFVGPNGAGKTTVLRMLAGEEQPDAGAVHRPLGSRVGYLPQEIETVEAGSVLGAVLAAFPEIAELEGRLEALEHRLAELRPGDAGAEELVQRYGELRHRLEDLDGRRLEARAKAILSGLGIEERRFHEPLAQLSGGWRMRAVLARLLLTAPELLLLDEPTNHLDLEALGWLEEFLQSYPGAFVAVSHDRFFLNRMVRGIVELELGRLGHYTGNYDDYVTAKQEQETRLQAAAKQQAREIARVERFIERFRYKNTKARQVQSRIRSLDKLQRVHTSRSPGQIYFGFAPAPRSGETVVRARALCKSYGAKTVYAGLDFLLRRGDRVALVGPNGAGKSTLLKLIAGRTPVDGGTLELGHNVTLHYYAQHQLDELHPDASVIEEAERVVAPGERPRLRRLLGCFLFSGADVDKRVRVLSGGEKARLALAKLLLRPANLLLLDEPTNHLDLRSREVLEDALNEYEGSLVVISHDRYFINRVATTVADVRDGRIERYEGDYDEYLAWRREHAAPAAADEPPPASPSRPGRRGEKRREAEQRSQAHRERRDRERRLAPIEREITDLEQQLAELDRLQSDPATYRDPERAADVARRRSGLDARLQQLYADWEAEVS